MSAPGNAGQQGVLQTSRRKRLQETLDGVLFLARQGESVQYHGSANGNDRRELPQYGAISRQQQQWLGGTQLREGHISGLEFGCAVQCNFGDCLRGESVEVDARAVLQRLGAFKQSELNYKSL